MNINFLNKKQIISFVFLIFLILHLFGSLVLNQIKNIGLKKTRATPGPTTVDLNFIGQSGALTAGNNYILTVSISRASNTPVIATARIIFEYPESLFNVPITNNNPNVVYIQPFAQSAALQTQVNTTTKQIILVADWPRDPSTGNLQPQTATTLPLAQITFPVKQTVTSSSTGTFNFKGAEIIGVRESGEIINLTVDSRNPLTVGGSISPTITLTPTRAPTPTSPPGMTPTPTSPPGMTPTPTSPSGNVTLNLRLKFQGILIKPSTITMPIRVKIGGRSLSTPTEYRIATFTSDDNGIWSGNVSFNLTPGGGHIVYVKGPKHIQKKICQNTPSESFPGTYRCTTGNITLNAGANTLDFSGILQLVGDLPQQDGIVNSYDTSLVRNNLGKTDAEALRLADLNLDGRVDTQDYSLVIAALSVRADEE